MAEKETVPDAIESAELDELRAENEALRRELESAKDVESVSHHRARNGWAIAIAIIASIVLFVSVPAVWLGRMITDTDVWVSTMAPLAEDPAIQDYVAAQASAAVIAQIDAQTRLQQILPENLQILAAPISQAVESFVTKEATTLVRSDQFAQLWNQVNRAGHTAFVTAMTGGKGSVSVEAGKITLDVGMLADAVKQRLVDAGLELAARIPTGSIDRTVVLYESPALAQMAVLFDAASRLSYLLPILGLGLAALAIGLASDRRRVALWLGAGIFVAGLLPLESIYLAQAAVAGKLSSLAGIPSNAAQNAYSIVFRDLVTAERTMIAVGLVIWLAAIIAGPAKWAVAMRTGLSGGLEGVASHLELGSFGRWVSRRKGGLRWVGLAIAIGILLSLPAPRTVSSVVWLTVFFIVWLLAVELLGAGSPAAAIEGATGEPISEAAEADVGEGESADEPAAALMSASEKDDSERD
jgi:hypothetical protein